MYSNYKNTEFIYFLLHVLYKDITWKLPFFNYNNLQVNEKILNNDEKKERRVFFRFVIRFEIKYILKLKGIRQWNKKRL